MAGTTEDLRERYVHLLRRALTRHEMETAVWYTPLHAQHAPRRLRPFVEAGQKATRRFGIEVARRRDPATSNAREGGTDWPQSAETMVGLARLDNLYECLQTIFADDVSGDILEAGVWRGGASIFMRGICVAYNQGNRTSWLADSFQGLPPAEATADTGSVLHEFDELSVSVDQVQANFEKYDLLDPDHVRFLEGWFSDTLPTAPVGQLALLRLDGDLYSSTMQTLEPLYPKVVVGGFVVVDDYLRIPSCKEAVDEYRDRLGVTDPIVPIDGDGVYWRKG